MPTKKSNFLDKVLGRIGRLDNEGLQTVVHHLARERNFLENLFNTIEDGVLVVDESGHILYFNQAVSELLGWQSEHVEGQLITRYLPKSTWRKLSQMDRTEGQRFIRHEFEVSYPRPRFLRLYASPLDDEAGGNSGLALILHDATEARKKNFEAIESERIQALTMLAASVAHEIGNPMNALHIHLQLIEREVNKLKSFDGPIEERPPSMNSSRVAPVLTNSLEIDEIVPKIRKYLNVATGEISRLDYIITQFLQAIRPSLPKFRKSSLNTIVRETLALLKPELENRGIVVDEVLARRLPYASFDPEQIKQVLVNIIKNAMQAMTKSGELAIISGKASDGVWISISDTGSGIPQDKINQIFQPFYTTKKKGSGLGLMIVQRIMREHGGRVELESHIGQGTKFGIWLPLDERKPRLLGDASS